MTSGPPARIAIVQFAEDGDTSGYFPAFAKYYDRSTYSMTFGTLKVMSPPLQAFMLERGVETFSCNAAGRLTYGAAFARLFRFLRNRPCKVFHAHLFDASIVGLAAARAARVGARILTRHYSNYHTRINRPIHVQIDKWCTSLSHHVIAVSGETAQHLVEVEGVPREKVTAIHNGIDFERVRVSTASARSQVRAELELGEMFVFLIAGRLHPEKGYEHLFRALHLLKDRVSRPFVLLVAGQGPLLGHYRALTASFGVEDRVRFLGFRRDLPDLMAASDVFVLPSVAESFGLVLAEALYLGLPVIASRVGGIPEIVDDGVDGRLVPPGDSAMLAEALEAFLRGIVILPGQGEAAVKKVRARFDFQQMLRKYEAVYERVLAEAR